MLRAGTAVIGIWNEAFDLEGSPADGATTVPGVQRMLKAGHGSLDNLSTGVKP
jgi:type IV secretion system protein VirB9